LILKVVKVDFVADEQQISAALTDAEAAAAWSEPRCAACERTKSRASAFCLSCTLALQIWVRNWLALGPKDSRFADTYRSALQHLRLHRRRIKRLDGWNFESLEEIEAAGYTILNVSRCKAVGCNQQIGWVESPTGNKIPVNLSDFQPHKTSCKNPGVYRAKKSVQASARRVSRRGQR
jgi:hypothetical protein